MLWFLAHLLNGMANKSDGTIRHLMAQMSNPPPPRCSQEELLGVGRWAHRINFKHGTFAIEKGTNTSPRQKLMLVLQEGLEGPGVLEREAMEASAAAGLQSQCGQHQG